jgi:hypothetical protein
LAAILPLAASGNRRTAARVACPGVGVAILLATPGPPAAAPRVIPARAGETTTTMPAREATTPAMRPDEPAATTAMGLAAAASTTAMAPAAPRLGQRGAGEEQTRHCHGGYQPDRWAVRAATVCVSHDR